MAISPRLLAWVLVSIGLAIAGVVASGAMIAAGFDPTNQAVGNVHPQGDIGPATLNLNNGEPVTLDPAKATDSTSLNVIDQLFVGLVELDDTTAEVRPKLAASWLISPDGLVYTFTLHSDAFWTDGTPVTAEDVRYGMLRGLSLGSDYPSSLLYPIQNAQDYRQGKITDPNQVGITALNTATLRITLTRATAGLLAILSQPFVRPMPQQAIDAWGNNWTDPAHIVTNGPYRLTEWVHNDLILLDKNGAYFDAANVQIDRVNMRTVDSTTGWIMYLNGQLDTASLPSGFAIDPAVQSEIHIYPSAGTYYYNFSTTQAPFTNTLVRKAFIAATDRQGLVTSVVRGGALPALTFAPPGVFGHVDGANEGVGIPYDPVQARQWLADAGYPNGQGLPPISLWFGTSTSNQAIAAYVRDSWFATLGVSVTLQSVSSNYYGQIGSGQWQVSRLGWMPDYLDASDFLGDAINAFRGALGNWNNPTYQSFLDQAARESDPAVRRALYGQAEQILVQTDAVVMPLYYYVSQVATKPYLTRTYSPFGHGSVAGWRIGARPAVTPTPPRLGQPGTSFRYVQTFGQTEAAYFEDTSRLNYPVGLATDGTNVWIADSLGLRALKFTSDGAFVKQIGKAGFRYGAVPSGGLDWVSDLAVDPSGNVWLVDGNAHYILEFDASNTKIGQLGQSFSSGSDKGRFNSPQGIAFDSSGNIYVSDSNNHRVQVFSSSGVYSTTIGTGSSTSTNTGFNSPQHIAIDSNDYLYVADANNHRVQIFDPSHVYVATLGTSGSSGSDSGRFNSPKGVAVDSGRIYVADTNNNRVQVFDRTTRTYQSTLGTGSRGSGVGQFDTPADVAVDAAGNIYVAEQSRNSRVQQFNSSLAHVRTYGTTGAPYLTDGVHYNQPSGVVVAADGHVYAVEARGQRLVKLNAAGALEWAVGEAGVGGSDNAHFSNPNGLAQDGAGRVYVADSSNSRVQIFNPDGSYVATLGTGSNGGGDYQFNKPRGVAVDSAGTIYVADRYNHRVQVYDGNRTRIATLGATGLPGSDNAHFWEPYDVAVDAARNLYVVDRRNQRVQVFDSSRSYVRTIGVVGISGNDFGHLSNPYAVAVDAAGRTYVSDQTGSRVQVFDNTGAYLTTVGGSGGSRSGDTRQIEGLAVDGSGALYAADLLSHRIQKYALGVPGWRQSNLKGFGDVFNVGIGALEPFGGHLYAGTLVGPSGAQIWRRGEDSGWTAVITNGFGTTRDVGIDDLAEFGGRLYAGTWADTVNGGEVWRSGDGLTWTRVVSGGFGDTKNAEVFRFGVFSNTLYASPWSYDPATHGGEIWRSPTGDPGDWTRVVTNGFGDNNNQAIISYAELGGFLYAGTYNSATGGEVWRSADGISWTQVNADGFGSANYRTIPALAAFNGYLYASTSGRSSLGIGTTVWRCQVCSGGDWAKVVDNGFGNGNTSGAGALEVLAGRLYLVVGNSTTGLEVWRSRTGNAGEWEQVGFAGFGNSKNLGSYWDNSVTVFANRLFVGTDPSNAYGGEVWQQKVRADFVASSPSGPAPLTVVFTNTSDGGYSTSLWSFGDGVTSTVASPSHTYTAPGSYTVTLTVGDGVDTDTIVRPAFVQVQPGGVPGVMISLAPGWNLVSLTYSPTVPYAASALVASMAGQGVAVSHVARWHDGAWQSYIPGFPVNDFPLEFGQGYFVRVGAGGRWRP